MSRPLRIEFCGALYHVITRGNYRADVFGSAGAAQAFQALLECACERFHWELHAYVIMRNHFHLAVGTPLPNLSLGMHWLLGTFANRFNRFRSESGHLFQGRYQALLLEDEQVLAYVADYIHLNPVRAGLIEPAQVGQFRWSSLRAHLRGDRDRILKGAPVLRVHGLVNWSDYVTRLIALANDENEQRRLGFETFKSGFAIGTAGWRKAIAKEHRARVLAPGVEAAEIRPLLEAEWTGRLNDIFERRGIEPERVRRERKSARWKVEIASELRGHGVPYCWVAEQLDMGKPNSVRSYVNRLQQQRVSP